MRWLRLLVSMVLFPLSLVWYRRDVGPGGVGVRIYWPVMIVWVAVNIVLVVLAYDAVKPKIDELRQLFQ